MKSSLKLKRKHSQILWTSAILALAAHSAVAQTASPPTDPQIAHIAVTANQVDSDAGALGARMALNREVKNFAKQMVTDHNSVIRQANDLVNKLNVIPENNDTSKELSRGGTENLNHLKTLRGKAFDRAYVDHEVEYHQQVLDTLDQTLIPNAQNAELKDLLVRTRSVIAQHLSHARALQVQLARRI